MRLSEQPCHNVFMLDEDKDEPTFVNEVGKFFLLEKVKGKRRKQTFYIFKAILNDGTRKFMMSDGEGWIMDGDNYESLWIQARIHSQNVK